MEQLDNMYSSITQNIGAVSASLREEIEEIRGNIEKMQNRPALVSHPVSSQESKFSNASSSSKAVLKESSCQQSGDSSVVVIRGLPVTGNPAATEAFVIAWLESLDPEAATLVVSIRIMVPEQIERFKGSHITVVLKGLSSSGQLLTAFRQALKTDPGALGGARLESADDQSPRSQGRGKKGSRKGKRKNANSKSSTASIPGQPQVLQVTAPSVFPPALSAAPAPVQYFASQAAPSANLTGATNAPDRLDRLTDILAQMVQGSHVSTSTVRDR